MTGQLIGGTRTSLEYVKTLGQFRNAQNKRFVDRATVLQVVDTEAQRTALQLQGHTRLMASGKISLSEWQERMAASVKSSHLRQALMGSGGKLQMTQQQYGFVGSRLAKEYQAIDQFAQALARGEVTEKQALARAAQYGRSTALSFHQAEKVTRIRDGFVGKRSLDPQARHCEECPIYSTQGQFVPAAEIVPTGTNCSCSGRCRCLVVWKKPRSLNIDSSNLLAG